MSDIKIHKTNVLTANVHDLIKNGFDVEFTGGQIIIGTSVDGDEIVSRAGELFVVNHLEEKREDQKWINPSLETLKEINI